MRFFPVYINSNVFTLGIINACKMMPFFAFDDWTGIDVKYFSLLVVSVEEAKTRGANFDVEQAASMLVSYGIK